MSCCYFAAFPLLSAVFLATPVLAESPFVGARDLNVRQLLETNSCQGCDLVGVDLRGAHLIGADLSGANLAGADLSWVNLEGADLTKANLEQANLMGAFLTNASLAGADLDNANLSEAQLYFVDVSDASMENLNLTEAIIVGTPISVGGGAEPFEEKLPVISPEETWQPKPPATPQFPPDVLIDVPDAILPML